MPLILLKAAVEDCTQNQQVSFSHLKIIHFSATGRRLIMPVMTRKSSQGVEHLRLNLQLGGRDSSISMLLRQCFVRVLISFETILNAENMAVLQRYS